MPQALTHLIREVPIQDRPRERLERLGAKGLTDAELLAIFLRTGCKGTSVVQLAESLLKRFGGLEQLSRRSISEMAVVKGVGKAKAISLRAAFELHERVNSKAMQSVPLDNPERIYQFMIERVRFLNVEVLHGLALDSKLRIVWCYEVTRGLLNQTLVHAREIFREAISASAAHLVLVHNHPSGDPKPSPDDIRSTRELMQAGKLLGIPVLDHVIIGRPSDANPKGYVSLKEAGVIGN